MKPLLMLSSCPHRWLIRLSKLVFEEAPKGSCVLALITCNLGDAFKNIFTVSDWKFVENAYKKVKFWPSLPPAIPSKLPLKIRFA